MFSFLIREHRPLLHYTQTNVKFFVPENLGDAAKGLTIFGKTSIQKTTSMGPNITQVNLIIHSDLEEHLFKYIYMLLNILEKILNQPSFK